MMPAAIPPVDPTFGGMLAQTGPGSWAQPAWTGGAFGAGTGALAASTPSVASPAAAPASSSFAGTAPGVAGGTAAGGAAASSGIANLLSSPMALGMGAGALLGGLGGSEQAGTVTVEEGLPDWLQGYAKPALDRYTSELQNFNVDPYGVLPSAMKEFHLRTCQVIATSPVKVVFSQRRMVQCSWLGALFVPLGCVSSLPRNVQGPLVAPASGASRKWSPPQ